MVVPYLLARSTEECGEGGRPDHSGQYVDEPSSWSTYEGYDPGTTSTRCENERRLKTRCARAVGIVPRQLGPTTEPYLPIGVGVGPTRVARVSRLLPINGPSRTSVAHHDDALKTS